MSETCGAKTERGPCQSPPMRGRARCYHHGGAPGSGRPIVHGRYSNLAKVLGPVWDAIQADPNLRDLNGDLGLSLARERELLDRLDAGDSPTFREDAWRLMQAVLSCVERRDQDALGPALACLRDHLKEGHDRDGVWALLLDNSAKKAKLTQQAVTCETREHNSLTARAALALMATIFHIVKSEVGEDGAYRVGRRFQAELGRTLQPDICIPAVSVGGEPG